MRTQRAGRGFTLVELLVVIGIIGLLIAILVPTISRAVRTVRATGTRGAIRDLGMALGAFKADFKEYPPSRREPSGNPPTGASALAYYLRGPAGSGWGIAGGGLMPFDTAANPRGATRSYGPYYEADDAAMKWDGASSQARVLGFYDGFSPAGLILYFRANVDASGVVTYEWGDNNLGGAVDPTGKANYATQDYFYNCLAFTPSHVGGTTPTRLYYRSDYFLVSPGQDGRYGAVTRDDQGNIIPTKRSVGDYDDITNFN